MAIPQTLNPTIQSLETVMRLKPLVISVALLVLPFAALAHDVVKGPNGGQIIDDAGHHVELTANGNEIALYLSDNADKPISSANATGRVIVQEGGKQAAVDLAVVEPNILTAKLVAPLLAGAKLAVTIKLGDGHDVKARFVMR
jgi:hypothetical protein